MHNFSDPRALPLPSVVPMSAGTGSSPRRSPRVHEVRLIGSERHRLILAERVALDASELNSAQILSS